MTKTHGNASTMLINGLIVLCSGFRCDGGPTLIQHRVNVSCLLDIILFSGLSCYSCLDVEILETDRSHDSLYHSLVSVHFGGVDPGSCASSSMSQCSDGEVCFSVNTTAEGVCKYDITM